MEGEFKRQIPVVFRMVNSWRDPLSFIAIQNLLFKYCFITTVALSCRSNAWECSVYFHKVPINRNKARVITSQYYRLSLKYSRLNLKYLYRKISVKQVLDLSLSANPLYCIHASMVFYVTIIIICKFWIVFSFRSLYVHNHIWYYSIYILDKKNVILVKISTFEVWLSFSIFNISILSIIITRMSSFLPGYYYLLWYVLLS